MTSFLILEQACKLKFRLRDLTFYLCSAVAPAVCFKGRVAGVEAAEKRKMEMSSLNLNLIYQLVLESRILSLVMKFVSSMI